MTITYTQCFTGTKFLDTLVHFIRQHRRVFIDTFHHSSTEFYCNTFICNKVKLRGEGVGVGGVKGWVAQSVTAQITSASFLVQVRAG